MPTQSLGFVSLAPRGDWNANTTYKRLDTVNYGGSSYIVLKALTGVTPVGDNVNYMLLASKGDNAFQVWLLQPGNEGKTYEDYEAWLRQPATDAGGRADEAANKAQGAADNANNAAMTAQEAAQNANTAAEEARTNAASAENAADAAREATNNANNAATLANDAAENANEAAGTIDDKISLMGRIIESLVEDIDDTPGFWSSGFGPNTKGTKPTAVGYGSVCQVSNTINSPMTGGQTWVFQFAHLHGVDRPYWRRQFNNTGWSAWKQVALMEDISPVGAIRFDQILDADNIAVELGHITRRVIDCHSKAGLGYISRAAIGLLNDPGFSTLIISAGLDDNGTQWADWKFRHTDGRIIAPNSKYFAFDDDVLKNSGEQTLSNGRFNILVSAPEHVIMFKDAIGNMGYIGFGGYPTKDIHIYNYESGKFINIAADGKLYYDSKELAFNKDIISAISWASGTEYGPRLDIIRQGGTDPVSATIPRASTSESGVITTIAQAFAGRKSFNAGIDITAGGMSVNGGISVDNGTITCTGEISAANGFYETSDIRLKKNITPVHLSGKRIRLCEFDKAGRHSYGVIAQEVEKLYPSTVKENEEGHKVVNYIEVLTIKCAEQDERIEALEKENQELKDRLERLEKLLLK